MKPSNLQTKNALIGKAFISNFLGKGAKPDARRAALNDKSERTQNIAFNLSSIWKGFSFFCIT